MSDAIERLPIDEELKKRIREASDRLAVAERELTLAMEAITAPILDADNEMVGERLRSALQELSAARRALALEQVIA